MERELPAWQPFDPGEPGSGISLASRSDGGAAHVVLLLATEEAARDGWAARAAVSVVRQLASGNGRALLADLDLRAPRLHDVLGVSNDEGVSDVFLWGASFQRVAHSVEPGLLFAPAGTVVADPAVVAESPRWDAVTDGFRQARATLALYVPHDMPGLHHLMDRSSDVVALAARGEAEALALGEWRHRVRAVLGPPPSAAGAAAGTTDGAVGEGPSSPGREAPPDEPAPDRAWEEEISRVVSDVESRGVRPGVWALVALLVVVAVVVVAWAGWVDVPYLTPLLTGPTEVVEGGDTGVAADDDPAADDPAPAPTEPGATPAEDEATPAEDEAPPAVVGAGAEAELQRFSLQLGAYPDVASAVEAMSSMAARRSDVPFVVAPVEVDGRVFHRVLAGLAGDTPDVTALRASLAETMGAAEVERWLVRDARWAYLLGEFGSLVEARSRAAEIGSGSVQPYVLEVAAAEGGPVYRVYAGGYGDEAEASTLGALLAERGLTDVPLVQRIGRAPE